MYCVEDNDDGPGAFRACLDVGLARTSTGAKVQCTAMLFLLGMMTKLILTNHGGYDLMSLTK